MLMVVIGFNVASYDIAVISLALIVVLDHVLQLKLA